MHCGLIDILWRQHVRTRCWFRKPVLQFQGTARKWTS